MCDVHSGDAQVSITFHYDVTLVAAVGYTVVTYDRLSRGQLVAGQVRIIGENNYRSLDLAAGDISR